MTKKFKALKDNFMHPVTPVKKGDVIEIHVYTAKGLPAGEIKIEDGLNLSQKNFFLNDNFYENFIEFDKYRELVIDKILEDENIS
jgi:hypothetical protein